MTRRRADLFAAAAFGLLGLIFVWEGRDLAFTTEDGVPGAGFFPLLMAGATLVMALALGAQALRPAPRSATPVAAPAATAHDAPRSADDEPPSQSTVLADQTGLESLHPIGVAAPPEDPDDAPLSPRRTMVVWVLVLLAAVGLPVLGFIPAMLLLSGGITFGVERRFDLLSIVSAVLLPLLTYLLFGVLLEVRLPMGPFE